MIHVDRHSIRRALGWPFDSIERDGGVPLPPGAIVDYDCPSDKLPRFAAGAALFSPPGDAPSVYPSNDPHRYPSCLFRYLLARNLGRALLPWIMLNPSTASARKDDPSIGRVRWFSQREGFDGILVANAYALRSPHPETLWGAADPVGPLNDAILAEIGRRFPRIVCAWGANIGPARALQVRALLSAHGARLECLGVTKGGQPRHPLYVKGTTPLVQLPEVA